MARTSIKPRNIADVICWRGAPEGTQTSFLALISQASEGRKGGAIFNVKQLVGKKPDNLQHVNLVVKIVDKIDKNTNKKVTGTMAKLQAAGIMTMIKKAVGNTTNFTVGHK